MDYQKRSLELHKKHKGKVSIESKFPITNKDDLSTLYSPGVSAPSLAIAENPEQVFDYTIKGNTVAVVTDGSAVLGLGNIGPEAALPVMEGKAILFKEFAGIDAFPICLNTQDTEEIIKTIERIAPTFGGINLEDISAPRCFEIESRLQDLGIPVFHDDQHGTAIVVVAALLNAARVVDKKIEELNVVVNGSGAAGVAIMNLLSCVEKRDNMCVSVHNIIMCDSQGIVHKGRTDLSEIKQDIATRTNRDSLSGTLADALLGVDVFVGVSVGNILDEGMIKSMAQDPIVFALANPTPEIDPDRALAAGARVVATGRSDFPNQVNNVLVFPGIFKGALALRAKRITDEMKLAAVHALAGLVEKPREDYILPDPLDPRVVPKVSDAVQQAVKK